MDVRTVCLGLLLRQDATGYEIQKAMKEGWFSLFFDASYGSIYPALNRLTEEGLVTCQEMAQSGRPDKKVYCITPLGKEAFSAALMEPLAEDKFRSDFLAVTLFSNLMPPAYVKRLLDKRIEYHQEKLSAIDALQSGDRSPGEAYLAGYARMHHETAIEYIRENRHLVESRYGVPEFRNPGFKIGKKIGVK